MTFTILRAPGLAAISFLIAVFPGGVWTGLLIANLRINPKIPWAVAAMGFLLWLLCKYLNGGGPPRSTSASRHRLLRANPVSAPLFAWAMLAGVFGIIALAGVWIVLLDLVRLPARALPVFLKIPVIHCYHSHSHGLPGFFHSGGGGFQGLLPKFSREEAFWPTRDRSGRGRPGAGALLNSRVSVAGRALLFSCRFNTWHNRIPYQIDLTWNCRSLHRFARFFYIDMAL